MSSLKGCSLLLRGMLPYLQGEKAIEARLALVACRVPRISVEDQDRCYELLRKMRARARRTIRDSY